MADEIARRLVKLNSTLSIGHWIRETSEFKARELTIGKAMTMTSCASRPARSRSLQPRYSFATTNHVAVYGSIVRPGFWLNSRLWCRFAELRRSQRVSVRVLVQVRFESVRQPTFFFYEFFSVKVSRFRISLAQCFSVV